MAWVLFLCLALFPFRTYGQDRADMLMSADSLAYHSDFCYTQAELDSLLLLSPQIVLFHERIRTRNRQASFWRSITLHLTYDPLSEDIPQTIPKLWFGFRLPVGQLFQDTERLDEAELAVALLALRLQGRELMRQRQELLAELELEIQRYRTSILKLRKTQVSLTVNQTSSDEVLEAQDQLAERLISIRKKKLSIRLVEDRINALIGGL